MLLGEESSFATLLGRAVLEEPGGRPRFLAGVAVALTGVGLGAFDGFFGLAFDRTFRVVPSGRPRGFAGVDLLAVVLVVLVASLGGRPRPRLIGVAAFLGGMLMGCCTAARTLNDLGWYYCATRDAWVRNTGCCPVEVDQTRSRMFKRYWERSERR